MNLKQFIKKYNGVKVDKDNAHGAQCVDLARQYFEDVYGIPQPPPVDGAKDFWEKRGALKECQVLEPGDILIYGATEKNPFGHICILVSFLDSETFIVFEQDGFKQDGAKLNVRGKVNLIGGLYA